MHAYTYTNEQTIDTWLHHWTEMGWREPSSLLLHRLRHLQQGGYKTYIGRQTRAPDTLFDRVIRVGKRYQKIHPASTYIEVGRSCFHRNRCGTDRSEVHEVERGRSDTVHSDKAAPPRTGWRPARTGQGPGHTDTPVHWFDSCRSRWRIPRCLDIRNPAGYSWTRSPLALGRHSRKQIFTVVCEWGIVGIWGDVLRCASSQWLFLCVCVKIWMLKLQCFYTITAFYFMSFIVLVVL